MLDQSLLTSSQSYQYMRLIVNMFQEKTELVNGVKQLSHGCQKTTCTNTGDICKQVNGHKVSIYCMRYIINLIIFFRSILIDKLKVLNILILKLNV